MANFTESQVQRMIDDLKDEFGPEIATRELALLELEDLKRKGCALEFACKFDQCRKCSISSSCPVIGWEKRHPEYLNDELAMKIKVLEAGGEEAYQKKLEAAKKQDMKYTIDIEHCLVGNGQELDEYRIMDVDGNIVASTYDRKHAEDILKLANERW